jgi:hypothetical protein
MERITVLLDPEVYKDVIAQAKEEKRSKSNMAAILIKQGLDMPLAKATLAFSAEILKEQLESAGK